jgi:4'-phosphopantetheinyl transferase EntD
MSANVRGDTQLLSNPARRSPILQCIFPSSVVVTEMRGPGDGSLLHPAETDDLGRVAPKRLSDFSAGRLCARRALAELGITNFSLRVGRHRQPAWPHEVVGSITHTIGLCVAVVAYKRDWAAIGIDSEAVGRASLDMLTTICGPSEIAWIYSLPKAAQATAITLIFSAKEAFYKCQYPLAGESLGFHDLRIDSVTRGGVAQAEFAIHQTRALAFTRHACWPITGRYILHENYVTVGVGIAHRTPSVPTGVFGR